jgi:hypothetical protein
MKIIKKIAPISLGKILAVFYGVISLIFVPIMIIRAIRSENFKPVEIIFFIFLPLLYVIGGFIIGIISATVYNLCVKFIGGIKITLEDEDVFQS